VFGCVCFLLMIRMHSILAQSPTCIPQYAWMYNVNPFVSTTLVGVQASNFNVAEMMSKPETTAFALFFRAEIDLSFLHVQTIVTWGSSIHLYKLWCNAQSLFLEYRTSTIDTVAVSFRDGAMLDILIVQPTSDSRIFVYIDGRLLITTQDNIGISASAITEIIWGSTNNMVLNLQHVSLFNVIVTPDTICTSCIPNAGQGFSTDPTFITNAVSRIDTGIRADEILDSSSSTAFAFSARVKINKIGAGRYIFDFGDNDAGLSFGLQISYTQLVLVCRDTSGRTLQLFGVISGRTLEKALDSSNEIDILWVYQKSPANVMFWVNGKMVQHAKALMAKMSNFNNVQWQPPGTIMSLSFSNIQQISNVVFYDRVVTPRNKCNLCVPGEIGPYCVICTAGKYGAPQDHACSSCPQNSHSPAKSQFLTNCVCNAGYLQENSRTCTACPAGTYSTHSSDQTCTSCPEFSNSAMGSPSLADCTCNGGYSKQNDGTCTACRPGTYRVQGHAQTCVNCPEFTDSLAASSLPSNCVCKAGYLDANAGTCIPFFCSTGLNGVQCTCHVGYFPNTTTQSLSCEACAVTYKADDLTKAHANGIASDCIEFY